MDALKTVGTQGKRLVKARFAGPARAANRVGRIELPITLDGCGKSGVVCIPLSRVDELIKSLERSRVSAREIKRLRASRP